MTIITQQSAFWLCRLGQTNTRVDNLHLWRMCMYGNWFNTHWEVQRRPCTSQESASIRNTSNYPACLASHPIVCHLLLFDQIPPEVSPLRTSYLEACIFREFSNTHRSLRTSHELLPRVHQLWRSESHLIFLWSSIIMIRDDIFIFFLDIFW